MRTCALFSLALTTAISLVGCTSSETEAEAALAEEGIHSPAPATETCGLGWKEQPTSFAGVEGTYARAGATPSGEMKTLTLGTLVPASGHISSEADATQTYECGTTSCPAENVRASLLPTNHAMNPMILLSANGFTRPNPDLRGYYNVLGLERDATGTIAAMCLYRVDARVAGDPFVMRRR